MEIGEEFLDFGLGYEGIRIREFGVWVDEICF